MYIPHRLFRWTPLLLLPALLALGPRAHAWGVVGHRIINGLAIDSLPAEMKPLYVANRAWIVQHSIDPDDWRKNDRAEGPYHFIDMDAAWVDPTLGWPPDYWVACGLYGKETIDKNGVVPWRIGQFYGRLVHAFQKRDARAIVELSAWLGHYVGDIHVPFHASANYDGQETEQRGIHARFESILVERQIKQTDLKARPAVQIRAPVTAAFGWARESLHLVPEVLKADKKAVAIDSAYGDSYYAAFGAQAAPIARKRLEAGAHDLASLWYSAWVMASRPVLPAASDTHAGEPLDRPTRGPQSARVAGRAQRVAGRAVTSRIGKATL